MLFRARIALVAAFVLLGGTILVAMIAGGSLKKDAFDAVSAHVQQAQAAFGALERMRGIEVTNEAARFAREDETSKIFENAPGDPQRHLAFAAVEVYNARLGTEGHKADIVAILGANGHVVSRDLNIGVLYDEDLKSKYPAVRIALAGTAVKDLWLFDGHMYRVAVAPIRSRTGQVVGAMLVGYVTSTKDAKDDRMRLGANVAYFMDGRIHASSFSKEGAESAEEKDIALALFAPGGPAESAAAGELSRNFTLGVAGQPYLAAAGPLPGNLTKGKSGFVVLASQQEAQGTITKVEGLIYALGGLGLLCVLGTAVGTALRFVHPLDQIEGGVTDVINGNHEHTFETDSPDFEGLANGLNVMVARLTGRPDPTDDELDGGHGQAASPAWQNEIAVDSVASTGPQLSPENARIAAEPEADYFRRTFDEYIASRQKNGEPNESFTLETFTSKLKTNELPLRTKFSVPRVRFKVVVKDGVTTLKPIPIPASFA